MRAQLAGRALAIAWSAGGRLLAVALAGGGVSLRSRSGAQAAALCTPGPVAAIAWRPPRCARGSTEPRLHAFARAACAGWRQTASAACSLHTRPAHCGAEWWADATMSWRQHGLAVCHVTRAAPWAKPF